MSSPVRHALAWLCVTASLASAQYTRINVAIGPRDSEGTLHLYLFDSRRTSIKMISQGEPGTSLYKDLGAAMQAHKCEAGCNGGPADPQGQPLGLVIASGKRYGQPASKSDRTEGVLYLDGSQPRLKRAAAFFASKAAQPRHLLQAGPFLVESGKARPGLDSRRVARRTFVLSDGDYRWAIGYAPATTLQKLALALADSKTFKAFNVAAALNLEGASHSGIWINREHGQLYLKELRGARNFLGLVNLDPLRDQGSRSPAAADR